MDAILKYLNNTLGLSGTVTKLPASLLNKLPLNLSHAFNYGMLEIDGSSFILAEDGIMNSKTAGQMKKTGKSNISLYRFTCCFCIVQSKYANETKYESGLDTEITFEIFADRLKNTFGL